MKIQDVTLTADRKVMIILDDGTQLYLEPRHMGVIEKYSLLDSLRSNITYALDDVIEEGWIDLDGYDGSREEFEDEIYIDYEDKILNGSYPPDEEDLQDAILDLADFYEIRKEG